MIYLVAQVKGFEPKFATLTGTMITPAIEYRQVQVQGLWPIIAYLDEIRPIPCLTPETPEKRAIVRSFTELLLSDTAHLHQLNQLYEANGKVRCFDFVSLLDIAVATYHQEMFTESYSWIKAVHDEVQRLIQAVNDERYAD
jgi:glutathione S-transferase